MSDIFLTALQSAFSDAMETALAAKIAEWHAQHSQVVDALVTKVQALETRFGNLIVTTSDVDCSDADLSTIAQRLSDTQLETVAQHISDMQLAQIANHIDTAQLVSELTDGQLNDIAGDIDLADLAGEFDLEKVAEKIDLDEKFKEFFDDNTFSIRP